MPQNIYDDPDFFAGYKRLRDTPLNFNEMLEQPAIRGLLPELAGKSVLELGCGMGRFARWCVEQGAEHVTGVDVSEKMPAVARQTNTLPQITYVQSAIEDLSLPEANYDVVVSSLAPHYVSDYASAVRKAHDSLTGQGRFVFSVEHPLMTASPHLDWAKDAQGQKLSWTLDDYQNDGERVYEWFVKGVVKCHRTMATYLNTLIQAGFCTERLEEPQISAEAVAAHPEFADQNRRPPFLLIKAGRERVQTAESLLRQPCAGKRHRRT